jgi:hypothetical protein
VYVLSFIFYVLMLFAARARNCAATASAAVLFIVWAAPSRVTAGESIKERADRGLDPDLIVDIVAVEKPRPDQRRHIPRARLDHDASVAAAPPIPHAAHPRRRQ